MTRGAGPVGKRAAAALALAAAATPSSIAAQKVEYDARYPAKNREAAKLTSVAVLPFRGADGEAFTSALVGSLQSSTLDGKSYFTVKTIEGMNYSPPPPPQPASASRGRGRGRSAPAEAPLTRNGETANAIRLGQKLGVQAVYIGEVTSSAISRRNYTESSQVCASKGSNGKCNFQQQTIPCVDTTVNYSVNPRLVNVATGLIVYSGTIVTKDNYDVCGGKVKFKGTVADAVGNFGKQIGSMFKRTEKVNPNQRGAKPVEIATDQDLVTKVRGSAADAVRYDVSPYNFTVSVEFKQRAPELGKADQVKFQAASEFAKAKRLDRACSDWETLKTPANSGSINLLFNLGVCQEVLVPEDPNTALAFLVKADGLTTKPDAMINKALERVHKMVDAQTEISRQLKRN